MDHGDEIDDPVFWDIFGDCWTDTENMWQMETEILEILDICEYRDHRNAMMSEEEITFYQSLPEELVVFRGHQQLNKYGMSWTLSPWRARWFANRWSEHDMQITVAQCRKEDILGVFLGRSECEVAILPGNLKNEVALTEPVRPLSVQQARQHAIQQFELSDKSYHGPWHWSNVERNALALCEKTPGADPLVCQLFAVLHDCKRLNEDKDPQHGARAANFFRTIVGTLPITNEQSTKLFEAMVKHDWGETHVDPTIGVCWDADRLDLPRVNILPDTKYFSTQTAKDLMWKIP